ncbi:hypothetical protein BDB01DRAFT_297173 [Pilobolus umbonatus]|nr:hypothetical protein BDB01DRAFT_297173 [Pilobolus umbonatus]
MIGISRDCLCSFCTCREKYHQGRVYAFLLLHFSYQEKKFSYYLHSVCIQYSLFTLVILFSIVEYSSYIVSCPILSIVTVHCRWKTYFINTCIVSILFIVS